MPLNPTAAKPTVNFQIGRVYDRRTEINGIYGGSRQSGISPSLVTDAIFIFTGPSGSQFGYDDSEITDADGGTTFYYTGEGQVGDMTFRGGNKAIREHSQDGRALHLFRTLGKGKGQEYRGEYVYAGHRFEDGRDRDNNVRKIIIFTLVSVRDPALVELVDMPTDSTSLPKTLAEARLLAIAAAAGNDLQAGLSTVRNLYARSRAVKNYVLMRAAGVCESCHKPAPFSRPNGSPYLEPHHTTRVSDGGPDHPRFVGAICPACHREIHYGKDGDAKNSALSLQLQIIERA